MSRIETGDMQSRDEYLAKHAWSCLFSHMFLPETDLVSPI